MRNKSILVGLLLSVVFLVVGYFTVYSFYDFVLFSSKDVVFIKSFSDGGILEIFIYCLFVGLIPITVILTWQWTPVASLRNKIVSGLVIIACIFIAGLIRYHWVKLLARRATDTVKTKFLSKQADMQDIFPVSRVHIEIYMLGGLGSVIVYFIFRKKKEKPPRLSFDS